MKLTSSSPKNQSGPTHEPRPDRRRPGRGDLFLGYKALHELRILMRIAAGPAMADKTSKNSF